MAIRIRFYATIVLMMSMALKVDAKNDESPAYLRYVDEIVSTFAKEMYRDHDLECEGDGGRMPHDVEEISVQFVANRSATLEQARELEVMATEKLVQIINAHEKIRPFLREHPFTPGRACVRLSFRDPQKKRSQLTDNDVELVIHARNRIFYQAFNPLNPHLGKDIKDEPYEEALKIVQEKAAKVPSPNPKKV